MDPFRWVMQRECVYFPADSSMQYPIPTVYERGQSCAQDGVYQGQDGTCSSETTWFWKMVQNQSRRQNAEHILAHKNTCNFLELHWGIP